MSIFLRAMLQWSLVGCWLVGCAESDGRAEVGQSASALTLSYPSSPHHTVNQPTAPSGITAVYNVSNTTDLATALSFARSTGGVEINVSNINDDTFDVDLIGATDVIMNLDNVQLGSLDLGPGSARIEIESLERTAYFDQVWSSFRGTVSTCSDAPEDIAIVGINVLGVYDSIRLAADAIHLGSFKRVAIARNGVRSDQYGLFVDATTDCPGEDLYVFENAFLSEEQVGITTQATIRMHNTVRSLVWNNRLGNDNSNSKHNYRIHGESAYNSAIANVIQGGGVALGTCTASTCGADDDVEFQWFDANELCHNATDLYKLGYGYVTDVETSDNVAYSNTHSAQRNLEPFGSSDPTWTFADNEVGYWDGTHQDETPCPYEVVPEASEYETFWP